MIYITRINTYFFISLSILCIFVTSIKSLFRFVATLHITQSKMSYQCFLISNLAVIVIHMNVNHGGDYTCDSNEF